MSADRPVAAPSVNGRRRHGTEDAQLIVTE